MTVAPAPKHILPVLVLAQFMGTSLWFAGNAVLPNLVQHFPAAENLLANLTSMVQLGFISGTLVFAVFAVSDRFAPSKVFLICALAAALFNAGMTIGGIGIQTLLTFRFLTGFMLAGIYPVGMKIASDYFKEGLGKSLGFLVGALVLGTAFPHALKTFGSDFPWMYVIYATSVLAVLGGIAVGIFIPDGPNRQAGQPPKLTSFLAGFKNPDFRAAAFGYFGHMWELYTFWAFLPGILFLFKNHHPDPDLNVPLLSFCIIAIGSLSCMTGGLLSQRFGAKRIASLSLFLSGTCCVCSPLFLWQDSLLVFLCFLLFWGFFATADSPLFSSLIAKHAPVQSRGTCLTIVNCIGFAITILSIQVINLLSKHLAVQYLYMVLGIGPAMGLWFLFKRSKTTHHTELKPI